MLSIQGPKLQLNEHSMRVRQSGPGDRLRGTRWQLSGQETTNQHTLTTLRALHRRILGLNDFTSPAPFVSQQSPHMNGWYRILNATASMREHAGKTSLLDWSINALNVDAELELRISGIETPHAYTNNQYRGEAPMIGLPNPARGVFFPRNKAGSIPNGQTTARRNEVVRLWYPSSAIVNKGVRFHLAPEYGHYGQCQIALNDEIVVGLRPLVETVAKWSIDNGIVRVRAASGIDPDTGAITGLPGKLIFMRRESQTESPGFYWQDVVEFIPFASVTQSSLYNSSNSLANRLSHVNIVENEMHSATISLVFSTSSSGVRRDINITVKRGSSVVSLTTNGYHVGLKPQETSRYAAPTIRERSGAGWLAATNHNQPGIGTSDLWLGSSTNTAGLVAVNRSSGNAPDLVREWLGNRGAFMNWVIK